MNVHRNQPASFALQPPNFRENLKLLSKKEECCGIFSLFEEIKELFITYFCLWNLEKQQNQQSRELEKFENFTKKFFKLAKTTIEETKKDDTKKLIIQYKKLPGSLQKKIRKETSQVLKINMPKKNYEERCKIAESIFSEDPFLKIPQISRDKKTKKQKKDRHVLATALQKVEENLLLEMRKDK